MVTSALATRQPRPRDDRDARARAGRARARPSSADRCWESAGRCRRRRRRRGSRRRARGTATSPSEWPSGPRSNGSVDAGEHERPARRRADAGRSRCRRAARAETRRARGREIVRRRDLHVALVARHDRAPEWPARSASIASSVASTPRAPSATRVSQHVAAKSLRRLRQPDLVARNRRGDDGRRRDRRASRCRAPAPPAPRRRASRGAGDHAIDQRRVGERPRGVVHENDVDVRRQRREARAAPSPAAARRRPRTGTARDVGADERRRRRRPAPPAARRRAASTRGCASNAATLRCSIVRPPRSSNCFGTSRAHARRRGRPRR